jgi:hypothetical protein
VQDISRAAIQKKLDLLKTSTEQMRLTLTQLQANINGNEGAMQICELLLSETNKEMRIGENNE